METSTNYEFTSLEAAQILSVLSGAYGPVASEDRRRCLENFPKLDAENAQLAYDRAVRLIKSTKPRILSMPPKIRFIAIFVELNKVFRLKFPDFRVTDPVDLVSDDTTI